MTRPIPDATAEAFRQFRGQHNLGLWLDRLADTGGPEQHWEVTQAAKKREGASLKADPVLISQHLDRWWKMLEALGVTKAMQFPAQPDWRVIVGLGAESVLETSIRLQRLYGFPIIPGSALKGMTRAYAELVLEPGGRATVDAIWNVFGSQSGQTPHFAGQVVFFDAVPIAPPRITLDIMNPHYPPYYRQESNEWPADYWSPSPVYFLTVESTPEHLSPFLFAVGPRRVNNPDDAACARQAAKWLKEALQEIGVGAKTTSGYGYWAEIEDVEAAVPTPTADAEQYETPADYRRGRVKWFNAQKGYGFIQVDESQEDVFVHYTGIEGEGFRTLNENDRVEFSIEKDAEGLKAVDVRVIRG